MAFKEQELKHQRNDKDGMETCRKEGDEKDRDSGDDDEKDINAHFWINKA